MLTRSGPGSRDLVLLVDAHPDTRLMYTQVLEDQGFDVISAATPEQALALAPQANIVVMELLLPGFFDGIGLLERLKHEAGTRDIPVVIVTACVWPSERARALQAGCDRLLAKPCLPDDLAREIRPLVACPAARSVEFA